MLYRRFPIYLIRMAVFFRGFLLILLPSCGILEMRQCYGVWQVPKGSVADGHNCLAHGRWLWLRFVGESFLKVLWPYRGVRVI